MFSLFWTVQEALDHMGPGSSVIITGSINGLRGNKTLIDYSASKAAEDFGKQAPMGRAADPDEIAPSYVFFASDRQSSYYTGQTLVPAGGEIHPG